MSDAINTVEGIARIGLVDKLKALEAIEKEYAGTNTGRQATALKLHLLAKSHDDKKTSDGADFIAKRKLR